MVNKEKNRKTVVVDMTNPEGRMKLTVNGVDNALKIMKAFDEACEEIRKDEEKEK